MSLELIYTNSYNFICVESCLTNVSIVQGESGALSNLSIKYLFRFSNLKKLVREKFIHLFIVDSRCFLRPNNQKFYFIISGEKHSDKVPNYMIHLLQPC